MKIPGKHKRLWVKGSIIEPAIAMVILVMSIATAFSILTNLNLVPKLQAKNRANELINMEMRNVLDNKDLLDSENQYGGFRLIKTIEEASARNLVSIHLEIVDLKNKRIAKRTLIYTRRQLMGFSSNNE